MAETALESALTKIGEIALKGLPKDAGYIFYAADVRKVLCQLLINEHYAYCDYCTYGFEKQCLRLQGLLLCVEKDGAVCSSS